MEAEGNAEAEEQQVLRFHIDGQWTVQDFSDFFADFEFLAAVNYPITNSQASDDLRRVLHLLG